MFVYKESNMNKYILSFIGIVALLSVAASSGGPGVAPATQAESDAGIITYKFISPATGMGFSSAVKGGTNDDTAVLQGLMKNRNVKFPPGRYTTTGLFVTNNQQISGYGATITLKAGTTNIAVFNWVAGVTNVTLCGVKVDGLDYSDCTSSAVLRGIGVSNRMGINAYVNSSGSVIRDVTAVGFDKGITFFGDQDGLHIFQNGDITLSSSEVYSNFYGLFLETTNAANSVEYVTPVTMRVHDNTYGIVIRAGNIGIVGSDIENNWTGILVAGTGVANAAHGYVNNNKINHNLSYGADVRDVSSISGFQFANNQFLANTFGGIVISNSAGIRVEGNNMGNQQPVILGANGVAGSVAGPNFVINNAYHGAWGSHSDGFYIIDWQAFGAGASIFDQTTNVIHYGNYSTSVVGNRDPYLTDPFQTNAIMIVNGLYLSTNPPPAAATFNGQMYFWNSNALRMYLLKTTATTTTWGSTNLIN